MAEYKTTGEVENVSYETKHIEWRIPDFFVDTEDEYFFRSPYFTIKDTEFYLSLRMADDFGWIEIHICRNEPGFVLGYCFGLKNCDGTVEDVVVGTVGKEEEYSDWEFLIMKEELFQRKTELIPSNILTVTCALKMTAISHSAEPNTMFEKSILLKLTKLDKLSKNFRDLLADQETCDVTLKVKDKEYKAHKFVLIARSSVFSGNFKHDTLERQTGVIIIPDCDPDSFQIFLEYLYCGELEELSFEGALNLYYTSDKYDIAELKTFCIECMVQCMTVENMCEILLLANKYDETELFSSVQNFFNENSSKILVSPEWECLLKNDYPLSNKLVTGVWKVKLKQ